MINVIIMTKNNARKPIAGINFFMSERAWWAPSDARQCWVGLLVLLVEVIL